MKKSIFTLAILGALNNSALAQTNVSIFGRVDVGIQRIDSNAPGVDPTWTMESGVMNGSRLGFRGTEDLGGGLSGIFLLENGFNVDTGTAGQGGALFGRQAWVGLARSGIGELKLGRQYTPIHLALDAIDPFGTGLAGNIEGVFSGGGIRMNNTVNFTSANFGGFSGEVAYGFGENAGTFSAGSQLGAAGTYKSGPIHAVIAHHRLKPAVLTAGVVTSTTQDAVTMMGGVYNFGAAKVHLAVAANESEGATGATTGKSRDWMAGVTVPMGAGALIASLNRHNQREGTVGSPGVSVPLGTGASAVSGADYDQWALGYIHSLSKRSYLYSSLGRINRKTAGSPDVNLFNVGIQHRF